MDEQEERFAVNGERQAWVETPAGDGWTAAFRLVVKGQRVVVAEVRCFPSPTTEEAERVFATGRPIGQSAAEVVGAKATVPEGGLTRRRLQQVAFAAAERGARELLRHVAREEGRSDLLLAEATSALQPRRARGRRRQRSGEESRELKLARVAALYVGAHAAGNRMATKTVAAQLGVSTGRIRQQLVEARREGLLVKPEPGKPGGELTAKARQLLGLETEVKEEGGS